MIKALEIENFKGIGDRVRVEFAPITLLFGPNSAGKSTVIQALAYLHSLLTENCIDVRNTKIGGDAFDLGGFGNILHRHEDDREVTISLELSGKEELPKIYGCPEDDWGLIGNIRTGRFGIKLKIVGRGASEFTVMLDGIEAGTLAYDRRYIVDRNGHVAIMGVPTVAIEKINPFHPRFLHRREVLEDEVGKVNQARRFRREPPVIVREYTPGIPEDDSLLELSIGDDPIHLCPKLWTEDLLPCSAIVDVIEGAWGGVENVLPDGRVQGFGLDLAMFAPASETGSVPIPRENRRMEFPKEFYDQRSSTTYTYDDPYDTEPDLVSGEFRDCISVLSYLFVGITEVIRRELSIMFLGPLRAVPKRRDSIWRSDITSAAQVTGSGLEAWRSLFTLSQWEFEELNEWLTSKERLALGVGLRRTTYLLVDDESRLGQHLSLPKNHFPVPEIWKGLLPTDYKRIWGCRELAAVGEDLPRQIELQLLDSRTDTVVMLEDVGVGISQVLPVVAWAIRKDQQSWISCVEQPELHLHPKAQLALGDLFIRTSYPVDDAAAEENPTSNTWLIETHSEHILLRLLRRIRETCSEDMDPGEFELQPEELAVNYIEMGPDGTRARRLHVNEDGDFAGDWPEGFFEERNEELF